MAPTINAPPSKLGTAGQPRQSHLEKSTTAITAGPAVPGGATMHDLASRRAGENEGGGDLAA